jgi:hypothetical protein
LNATVDPGGAATVWYFRFGETTNYGGFTATNILPAGTNPVPVNGTISGLLPGALYHCQAVASNSAGLGSGGDATFTTLAVTPPELTPPVILGGDSLQFTFTNTPGASFTVAATTNLALALSNWATLGAMTEVAPGLYLFTDTQAFNTPQRFYRAQLP